MTTVTVSVCKRTRAKGKQTKTWYLRWSCPDSGKRQYEATGATRKSVAEELAKEKQALLERKAAGLWDESEELRNATWAEARDAFLDAVEVRSRPATLKNYKRTLLAFERICKPKSARVITLAQVESFVAALGKEPSRKQGKVKQRNATTINVYLKELKAFLNWGRAAGYVEKAPKIKMLREITKPRVRLSGDAQSALLTAIDNPDCRIRFATRQWWRVWTLVLFYSGMRRGEMLELLWSDVSFTEQTMLVRGDHEKSSRYRKIPLSAEMLAVLQDWYRDRGEPEPTKRVFHNPNGLRQVYSDWMRIRETAGVGRVTFHNARSTAGSEVYQQFGLGAAQDWLGHSTPAITKAHYVDNSETLREVAAKRKTIK